MLKMAKFARPIVKITKKGLQFCAKNSNVILTVISAAGVVATATVAIHGTIKAIKLCEERKPVGTKEIVKTVWKCFIPTIGIVILTTVAIVSNGKINAKRIAVLTSAYSGAVETLKKVEEKMSDQIGPKKTLKAIDDAHGEMAKENLPATQKDIIATGNGNQLFWFSPTGQWFNSDWNGVELANQRIKNDFMEMKRDGLDEYFPVSCAQEALKLPSNEFGDNMAWPLDNFTRDNYPRLIISSEWMDLPWGRQVVGVVRFSDWPQNY